MTTLAYSENLEQMAKELDFGGVKGLIKDVLATQILARISGFSEEVEGFEAKYDKDYQSINNEFKKSDENFKKFDDLMAWRFAQEGKEYWQGRLKELKEWVYQQLEKAFLESADEDLLVNIQWEDSTLGN